MADASKLFPGKHFISTVLEALETKEAMSAELRRRYLMRAAMAGFIIGMLYVTIFGVQAAFAQAGGDAMLGVGKFVGAFIFGWALVFIYYSKSELLTSNMMMVTIGVYHHRTKVTRALRILGLCLLGNFIGGLALAILLRFSTILTGPAGELTDDAVAHKLEYVTQGAAGWGDLLVRAILCNFMINLGMLLVYNGVMKDDITKSLAMIVSVFVFVFLGLEHSVANAVLFTVVGLGSGIDVGLAVANVAIVLIGNYIGGGLLIGWYYSYVNDDSKYRKSVA